MVITLRRSRLQNGLHRLINKVVIANRGVAAVRIARTLKAMDIASVGLRTQAETDAGYFNDFDEVVDLQGSDVSTTYLDAEQILAAAEAVGADAIHPGYGFLSENADFAERAAARNVRFIGPSPQTLRTFGVKHIAREIAATVGVNLLPGTDLLADVQDAAKAAEKMGYPVILKSTAGGGGIGMQRCNNKDELLGAYASVVEMAAANFAEAGVFVEKFLTAARHVEVQIFGDGQGGVIVLGDRDCSLQRRNQKVVEECPAPNIPAQVREALHAQAAALGQHIHYASAGTVEFLYDSQTQQFYFLEVNTRLQVEHGVTELVYGIDLVEWMVRLADATLPSLETLRADLAPQGAAIQVRLYAEDPYLNFRPTPGQMDITFGKHQRLDTWVIGASQVSHWFDPLLANVMSFAETRTESISKLSTTLLDTQIHGIATNRDYLHAAINMPSFVEAEIHTGCLQDLEYVPNEFEVIHPGVQTTIQAYPGRQGYWEVGVPPSGPMDELSFQLGNRLLGNTAAAAGLEMVMAGLSLRFRNAATCVVTGANASVTVGAKAVACNQVFNVRPGETLTIADLNQGMRCYLLVRGGIAAKPFLGSAATFTLGQFGGHMGRALRAGDVLRWQSQDHLAAATKTQLSVASLYKNRLQIRVLMGPHGAPDFFTEADMDRLFNAAWDVHHNSSRTGVRLIGPRPDWAREDGGEAGLHPSNIHDNAYAFGAIDFTGDMPVVLGPDGPSLGGFVCPAVVITADRWKLGQLCPGESVALVPVDLEEALAASAQQEQWLQTLGRQVLSMPPTKRIDALATPILWQSDDQPQVLIRRAGQEWILVEIGALVLDLRSRVIVHHLVQAIRQSDLPGLVEMTPGIRSLQIRYAPKQWQVQALIRALQPMFQEALQSPASKLPTRIVRMPLAWNDPACLLAVERYMKGVRSDAPWCPDNIEFIRRINGLDDQQAVQDIVFNASYLVMGLGDVYLGAPVATPLDPRHRLVTTKYNPARTWTAENSVGIGGSYMCVYGMEGPGGYQFVGRTTPVWRQQGFAGDTDSCWLLRHFDQIQFYPVDSQELLELREAAQHGAFVPSIQTSEFDLIAHERFLANESESIASFSNQRDVAFREELARWQAVDLHDGPDESYEQVASGAFDRSSMLDSELLDGLVVESPMTASVWRIQTDSLASVSAGVDIIILEAMKTEFPIQAPVSGNVKYLVREGQTVTAGQPVAVIVSS